MSDKIKIKVDDLTDEEIAALEAQGADLSGPVVTVGKPQQSSRPVEEKPATTDESTEKKKVEAPAPSADVVERVKQRVENQQTLEGSSYEHRDADGKVVEQEGEVQDPRQTSDEPKEEPIEAYDKANFLAFVLGGERFSKSYSLFGGALVVTFATRTSIEDERCAKQSFDDEALEGGFGGSAQAVRDVQRMQRYFDYQFVASLVSIQTKDRPPRHFKPWEVKVPADHAEHLGWSGLRQARLELYAELSQPLRFALKTLHAKFESVVTRLAAAAEQPDFWTAGSDS